MHPAETLLDWHHARRAGGVPAVGVLAGPVGLGLRAWRRWAAGRGVPVVQTTGADPAEWARAWLAAAFAETDPVALARGRAAGVPDPATLTRFDLDRHWRSLPNDPADPAASAAYHVLLAALGGGPVEADRLAGDLAADADPIRGAARVFAGVYGLDPEARWPALLAVPPDAGDLPDWFRRAARLLEAIATAVPRLAVGVCVPPAVFEAAVAAGPASRMIALLREGVIPLRGTTAAELTDQLRAADVAPPPAATLHRLTADGLAPEVAAAFVEAARTVRTASPADAADDFRSVHERFLFEQLESLPATAGLFRPNRPLPFRHGTRDAEGDLVAERPKVVVEVDGSHYHLNQPQYRRDRRKDWLYQRHGYLVLRFLAEDVVDDLESILDTVLAAVALRGRSHP